MVTFSSYPGDPRPRRAADALRAEGMSIDLICLGDEGAPRRETLDGLDIIRVPITQRRGGKVSYFYRYAAFIFISTCILASRALKRRYDLVYVHNMPDILILSSLAPKALGAKVILDLHDPMPELMTAIYNLDPDGLSVRLMRRIEKWSLARTHSVVTVNRACQRIFGTRSCRPEKITVVMNSPDETIFPFRAPRIRQPAAEAPVRSFAIMYHGSLVERNGLDLAVEALEQARKTIPGAELRVYGRKTPFLQQVMDTAFRRGLGDSVRYLGPKSLEELVREIEICDVGIIPNHRNAFTDINTPTRLFEYLALGKPVIAPRTPGIQDYFTSESLLFFEPGNAKEIAEQLAYAYLYYSEALETAKRGQQAYLAHTWSQERQTLLNLVSRLVPERQTA